MTGKFRTYLSTNSSRGKAVTAGNPYEAHMRGWNAGVKIIHSVRDDRDVFTVFMTAGSNGTQVVQLGCVVDTGNGPAWEPTGKEKE